MKVWEPGDYKTWAEWRDIAVAAVTALLAVESGGEFSSLHQSFECPYCQYTPESAGGDGHDSDCPIDAALSMAALVTQKQRDEARRLIEEKKL